MPPRTSRITSFPLSQSSDTSSHTGETHADAVVATVAQQPVTSLSQKPSQRKQKLSQEEQWASASVIPMLPAMIPMLRQHIFNHHEILTLYNESQGLIKMSLKTYTLLREMVDKLMFVC